MSWRDWNRVREEHVHLHHHFDPDVVALLRGSNNGAVLAAITKLETSMSRITDEIDALASEVEALTTVNASALAAIDGFISQVEDNIGDETKLQSVLAGFKQKREDFAAAIAARTAAATEPPAPPVEPVP